MCTYGPYRSPGVELVEQDLVGIGSEAIHVLLNDQGLPVSGGLRRPHTDEVVHVVIGRLQSELQQVQISSYFEQVVHPSWTRGSSTGSPFFNWYPSVPLAYFISGVSV